MNLVCAPASESPLAPRITTRTQVALAACACGAATAFLFAVDPNHHAVYPQCPLYNTTGIYCAGCGATRATYALLHGRFVEALHDNALLVAALPLLLYVAISYAAKAWTANTWPQIHVNARTLAWRGGGVLILLFVFAILRNFHGWPFDWLKPIPPPP